MAFQQIKNWLYDHIILEIRDTKSLQQLMPLYGDYLPWSGASIRPSTLVYILNDIMINDRKVIVECGSGVSTLFIARYIQKMGREISFYTIDHESHWLDIIHEELNKQDLIEFVQTIHAPLVHDSMCWNNEHKWYDMKVIGESFNETNIDLLIVDGPPANQRGQKFSRFPTVPYFNSWLKNNYKVILDDAGRPAENKISKEWEKQLGTTFEQDLLHGNVYVGCGGELFYNI